MIIYDNNYKIFAMSDDLLHLIGYKTIQEFLSTHNNFEEIIENYKNEFIIKELIQKQEIKEIKIKNKYETTINLIAKADTLNANSSNFYVLKLILKNEFSKTRMPILRNLKQIKNNTINHQWLENVIANLNLEKNEYLDYLSIFINQTSNQDAYLQNAINNKDEHAIKKIIAKIKEPAQNLNISPMINILNNFKKANFSDFKILIEDINLCLIQLKTLIKQEKN